jgi:diadenosine tetraphosphatase ApaH/serine/threonine PP2A family protein phosphatase
MLIQPESLAAFAAQSKAPQSMWAAIAEMAEWSRQALGADRLSWLARMALARVHPPMALVHASPDDCWRSPIADASADELQNVYGALNQPVVVYGHIHVPFVRGIGALTVANSGSVGQPLDGDRRASYLLLDKSGPNIRRVEYDVGMEVRRLRESGLPHAEWLVKMLESARPAGME